MGAPSEFSVYAVFTSAPAASERPAFACAVRSSRRFKLWLSRNSAPPSCWQGLPMP